MSDDVLLPTDAEMDSRTNLRKRQVNGDWFWDGGAPVIPDTIKRANWALKRLEKRAKSRVPLPQNQEDGIE